MLLRGGAVVRLTSAAWTASGFPVIQARQRLAAADRSSGSAQGRKPKSCLVRFLSSSLAASRTTGSVSFSRPTSTGMAVASGSISESPTARALISGAG